jgi:hypothetical protein
MQESLSHSQRKNIPLRHHPLHPLKASISMVPKVSPLTPATANHAKMAYGTPRRRLVEELWRAVLGRTSRDFLQNNFGSYFGLRVATGYVIAYSYFFARNRLAAVA